MILFWKEKQVEFSYRKKLSRHIKHKKMTVDEIKNQEYPMGGVGEALILLITYLLYIYKKRLFLCVCLSIHLSKEISKVLVDPKGHVECSRLRDQLG